MTGCSGNGKKNGKQTIGAVLVVGAGFGGMQAALDLAEVGLRVYLLERSPAIGGLMAKLDIHNRTDLMKYALRRGIIVL